MAHSLRDMQAAAESEVQRRIMPVLIMDKFEIAVLSGRQHPYVGGYIVTIISSATASSAH